MKKKLKIKKLTKDEIKDLASFVRLSNSSVVNLEETNGATFQFASPKEENTIAPGPQKYLMAGQFFVIPKNTTVSIILKGRVTKGSGSRIFLKHDLASVSGRIRINKFMYKELKEGDLFSASYDFYNCETFYSTEFRVTAELLSGDTATIILDNASLGARAIVTDTATLCIVANQRIEQGEAGVIGLHACVIVGQFNIIDGHITTVTHVNAVATVCQDAPVNGHTITAGYKQVALFIAATGHIFDGCAATMD